MKKKGSLLLVLALCLALLSGCGSQPETAPPEAPAVSEAPTVSEAPAAEETPASPEAEAAPDQPEGALPDGVYSAKFESDSSMFHVNEAMEGRGVLTVENGEMVIHVSLQSKKVTNLYLGLAKDAKKEGAVLLEPTLDTVTYKDGMTDEVYGFDIPVPGIDEEFDCALIGNHGNWYDHKVVVSDPIPLEN